MGKSQKYRAVLVMLASLAIAAGATFAAYRNILLVSKQRPAQPVNKAASDVPAYAAITSLFNEARRSRTEVEARVTPFNPVLLGISYSDDPLLSMVALRKDNQQQNYHVGEKVRGHPDARIIHIGKDRVDISYNGKMIQLALSQRPANKASLTHYATEKIKCAPHVLQDWGRLVPLYDQNDILSWHFLPAAVSFSRYRWNLRKHDVVLAVNDLDIMTPQNSRQIERLWETAAHAKVKILRSGQIRNLELDANNECQTTL